jgi:serine protease AprX
MADRYIAVRRPERRSLGAATSRAVKRDELSAQRMHLRRRASTLSGVGLAEVASVEDLPPDPQQGGYTVLEGINALVVEPPVGTTVEALREQLDDDFIVMPDIELSLPGCALGREVDASSVSGIQPIPDAAGVKAAHAAGNRGGAAVIAVLDTGCDAGHPEFAGRTVEFAHVPPAETDPITTTFGFDLGRHGTHVAGIAGGASVGVAAEASLIVLSVLDNDTQRTTAVRLYRALGWLATRADEQQYAGRPLILNLSLGFKVADIPAEDLDSTLQSIRITLEDLVVLDVLPVVAIGNEGPGTFRAPGFYPESLSTGAVDYSGSVWPESGGGSGAPGFEADVNPDLVGYGVDVVSAFPRTPAGQPRYWCQSGTSMAAPYVAGIAALIATETSLEGAALRDALLNSALQLQDGPERVGRGLARYAPEVLT